MYWTEREFQVPPSNGKEKAVDATSAAELISERAAERTVLSFQVFGINSLKTLLDPAQLADQTLIKAELRNNLLSLLFDRNRVDVDLQRTGTVTWVDSEFTQDDTPVARRPTGRLIFKESGILEFTEPAKTKRIGFWIHSLEGSK
ncbi:hypothetical protein ACFCYB_06185 [Streptomyces sp. NPDC056309]